MIPRRGVKIKFFLSVVIPVVKAAFVPLSAIGGNPANAGAARLCGVSPCPVPDTATALPNVAPYQLGYTRIFACHDYSTKLMRLKVFCVCGHLCGQSGFSSCFDCREKSHKRPCCKGIQTLAVPIVDRRSNAPKAGALPTALHPVIQFIYPAGRILPNQARYQLRYTRIFGFAGHLLCGPIRIVSPDITAIRQKNGQSPYPCLELCIWDNT